MIFGVHKSQSEHVKIGTISHPMWIRINNQEVAPQSVLIKRQVTYEDYLEFKRSEGKDDKFSHPDDYNFYEVSID